MQRGCRAPGKVGASRGLTLMGKTASSVKCVPVECFRLQTETWNGSLRIGICRTGKVGDSAKAVVRPTAQAHKAVAYSEWRRIIRRRMRQRPPFYCLLHAQRPRRAPGDPGACPREDLRPGLASERGGPGLRRFRSTSLFPSCRGSFRATLSLRSLGLLQRHQEHPSPLDSECLRNPGVMHRGMLSRISRRAGIHLAWE